MSPARAGRLVPTAAELAGFAERVGWPVVLKTPTGGYDGKGVPVVDDVAAAGDWLRRVAVSGGALLAEARVDFVRELAVLVARSPMGQAAAWPVVETVQTDGICTEVVAPAPGLHPDLAARASAAALKIAGDLDVTGMLAVEMFEVRGADGRPDFLVNELAMRPHNSGHWTIDGRVTSQFEQHLRAVLDLPLGSTATHGRVVGHGQRAGRGPPGPLPRLPARHGSRPGGEGAPVRQGRAARAARSGTSRSAATTWTTAGSGPGTPPTTSAA